MADWIGLIDINISLTRNYENILKRTVNLNYGHLWKIMGFELKGVTFESLFLGNILIRVGI